MEITVGKAGKATMRIYDLTGKMVYSESLGNLTEGVHTRTVDCQALPHGMYLVNVVVGSQRATSKLIVR
jgi:flagellar hook assembly protein FlgD